MPVTVRWQDVPLREAVTRLVQSQRLSVWLDRRVDPTHRITQDTKAPLDELIVAAANQSDAEAIPFRDLFYVGPDRSVQELRTLLALSHQQTEMLQTAERTAMLKSAPLEIPRLAKPRELVERIATIAKIRIAKLDDVPHDLWAANQLPAMCPAEQLTLILIGFDLTWQAGSDGRSIQIVPIERPVVVRRMYPRSNLVELDSLPAGTIERGTDDQRVWVIGTVELHERLTGRSQARESQSNRKADNRDTGLKQVYTLRVKQQPIGKLLRQLSAQLDMRLVVDAMVTEEQLSQRVTFSVDKADLAELLNAASKPAGLVASVEDNTIRLRNP